MKISLLLNLVGLWLLTTGCATLLEVRVDILDRDRFKELSAVTGAEVEKIETRIRQNRAEGRYEKVRQNLKRDVESVVNALAQRGFISSTIKSSMINRRYELIEKRFAETLQSHNEALIKIDSARIITWSSEDKKNKSLQFKRRLFSEARLLFDLGDTTLSQLGAILEKELYEDAKGASNVTTDEIKQLMENSEFHKTQNDLTSLTQDAGLLHDPLSSSVINASSSMWKGKFNDTYAFGVFGNSDIAIVMESLGHYTIKGLRLDASKTIEFSRKAFLQSIKFMAATHGVSASATPDSSLEIRELAELRKTELEAETQRQLFHSAARSLLETIIAQKENLKDGKKLAEALKIIQLTFEAYKPQLSPTTNGGNP